ncbi:MAG: sugar ABC transporter permease [Candidatus Aenigmatarchaeota archaeon]
MKKGKLLRASLSIDKYARIIFSLPSLMILIPLIAFPTIYLIYLAFSRFDLTSMSQPEIIGLGNFIRISSDKYFWGSLINTFIMVISSIILEFILGLSLALILNEKIKGKRILQLLFIIPMMIPPIISGLTWRLLYDKFGPLTYILNIIGFRDIDLIGNPVLAKISIIITEVWKSSPFMFIILLAGLQAIPIELYDAAKVDGASPLQIFKHITWPMLIPAISIALTLRIIEAFKIFDTVYVITYGGPAFSTEVLSLYIYRMAFRFGDMGYASSLSYIMLLILTIITLILLRITKLERRLGWQT